MKSGRRKWLSKMMEREEYSYVVRFDYSYFHIRSRYDEFSVSCCQYQFIVDNIKDNHLLFSAYFLFSNDFIRCS